MSGARSRYTLAPSAYTGSLREGWTTDVVVDEVNTIPFMTPLYVEEPIVELIHQLCRDCWGRAVHLSPSLLDG